MISLLEEVHAECIQFSDGIILAACERHPWTRPNIELSENI